MIQHQHATTARGEETSGKTKALFANEIGHNCGDPRRSRLLCEYTADDALIVIDDGPAAGGNAPLVLLRTTVAVVFDKSKRAQVG